MKTLTILLIAGFLPCFTQTADDSTPATSNVLGSEFPRIHADLRATFRLKAPDAQKVDVNAGGAIYEMRKDAEGYWTATSAPLVPGFHYYALQMDGVAINDPGSETYYGVSRQYSGIEVPESGVDFYLPKNVPHGEVRECWYHSNITEPWRRCFVYTPPGYDRTKTRYPALYLQHGGGEDERGWVIQGHVAFIMDNLLAEGKTKPMIIVMDRGYATKPGEPLPAAPRPAPAGAAPGPAPRFLTSTTFEEVVVGELIPMIDSTYRTIPDRDHRAMAGLSMGGMQTFQVTLKHLNTFAYIGGFSGAGGGMGGTPVDTATAFNGVMTDAAAFNKKVKLVWIGIGTKEPERMYNSVKGFKDALDRGGIKCAYYESPGTAHEWQTWRRDLAQFAPLLFR